MNELERMIAGLPQPEPGKGLDERIGSLLVAGATRRPRARWRRAVVWPAVAACCGLLGFYLGRGSVVREIAVQPPALVPNMPGSRDSGPSQNLAAVDPRVVNLPLAEPEFARLFLRSEHGEGAFGPGPLTIKTSITP